MKLRKVLLYLIFVSCALGMIASGALLWVPSLQEDGYFKMNKATGEINDTKGNAVVEFVSAYVGEDIIEKSQQWHIIEPISEQEFSAKAQKVEVNVDGSIFACAPKTPTPTPVPEPTPTPTPVPTPIPAPDGKSSWGVKYTKVPEALQIANGGGVKVCVVDTGVANHPGLQGVVIAKDTMYSDDGTDYFGHGTHVIGTVAGPVGIGGSRASVISIKVLDNSGSGSTQAIIGGIQKCITKYGAKIVSASLGSDGGSYAFQQIVKWVSDQGVWFIMAGGNNGSSRFSYPAAYAAGIPRAIAVVATLSTGGKAIFSQYQPGFPPANVIGAPGAAIMSTYLGGAYRELSGTSMATPLVAGIVADMLTAGKTELKGNVSNDPAAGVIIDALKTVKGL